MDLIAKAVTLKSIKLNDPSAKNLLFSAKHSVLYSFDSKTHSWEKTETEGCLAIYKRAKPAVSVLFILNRLRPENFSCPLEQVQSVQLEGDLLMLLLKNSKVMGIWLFEERERQLALNVLQNLLSNPVEDEDDEDSDEAETTQQAQNLKPISVNDLLGNKTPEKSPSILDILAKAKVKTSPSLEQALLDNFEGKVSATTTLKSFTNSVCQFLQSNPQLLASLHRQLTKKDE